jgi:DNA repair photolyase
VRPKLISNPPNPWSSAHVEWLEEPPPATAEVYEEEATSVVTENDSPDVGFRWSLNPYRGCHHACAYCYARPSHQYLGFGAGTDFERRIVVKTNAPELLRKTLEKRSWKGELVALSGNTDCYQPLEASYGLTRRCLETLVEFGNPACVITKGILVRRDVDVLARLAKEASVRVHVSIPFATDRVARAIEPGVAAPVRRFEAMKALADAGVPVGLALAPLIPGLNDADVPELLRRAKDAGATSAFMTMVRLSGEVLPVFTERLRAAFPDRAEKVLSQIRDVRGGALNDTTWHDRMHGRGPRWDAVSDLFQVHVKRLGLDREEREERRDTFRRPSKQGTLFDA